jgi:hypothetical protein
MKKLFNILSILSLFAILLQFFYLEKNKKFYNNTFIGIKPRMKPNEGISIA